MDCRVTRLLLIYCSSLTIVSLVTKWPRQAYVEQGFSNVATSYYANRILT